MITYLLLPVMLVSFGFYVYSVYRCRLRTRVFAKACTSLVFTAIAVVASIAGGANRRYFVYMIIALGLCACGDVFLEISRHDELGINYFIYALLSFFMAHISFLLLFCRLSGVHPADLAATGVIVLLSILLAKKLRFDTLNMGGYVLCYTAVMSFMLVKSFSLLYGLQVFSPRNILVAVGAGLFFVSNLLYALVLFRPKPGAKALATASAAVYYVGQTLIALSVLFAH